MAATEQLVRLFEEYDIFGLDYIGVSPPAIEDLVQLPDEKGNDLDFEEKDWKRRDAMTDDLARYNDFISQHKVSFELQPETEVHAYFLNQVFKRLANKGIISITG